MRRELQKVLMIDQEIHYFIRRDSYYRKRVLMSILESNKYRHIVVTLLKKHRDIELCYIEAAADVYMNNSSAFYKKRNAEIKFIYDFLYILNKRKLNKDFAKKKKVLKETKDNRIKLFNYEEEIYR